MATLAVSAQAPVLVDDAGIGDDYLVETTDSDILAVGVPGKTVQYVRGVTPGFVTVTVSKGARSGSLEVEVTEDPLEVSLGAPEPQ